MLSYRSTLVKHSYSTLMDTCQWLSALGCKRAPEEAAHALVALCRKLVWADSRAQKAQFEILDSLLQEDEAQEGVLNSAISEPAGVNPLEEESPRFWCFASEYDKVYGTRFCSLLLGAFHALGYLIITCDGKVTAQESDSLDSWLCWLQNCTEWPTSRPLVEQSPLVPARHSFGKAL